MPSYYDVGLYRCIVKTHGFDVSEKKRTPCLWFRFTPMTSDGEGDYDRETRLWLTDKTIDRTILRLRDMGWSGAAFQELEPGGHTFRGVEVELFCAHNPEGYEDWQFPAPTGQVSQPKLGVARKLDALYGRALQRGAAAKPKRPAETVPPENNDDVPF